MGDPTFETTDPPASPRLLDQLRSRIRVKHYALRTEQVYVDWVKRYIRFHDRRHPRDLGAAEVEAFLSDLAVRRNVSASTQNQAKAALLFLYKEVLGIALPWVDEIVQARVARRLPVVLTTREVKCLLDELDGTMWLVAALLYGTGMRLLEGLRLRAKDLDFERRAIVVREGKGNVFPSPKRSVVPRSGVIRRHHLYPQSVQRAIKDAASRAALDKPVTPHTLRHSFATHLLQSGHDIRTVQELLGHASVETTMTDTHVLNIAGRGVRSPLDAL